MSVKLKTAADARAMRTVFPPEFKQKVNMDKVKLPLIKVWVQNEVARILGSDDDVVIGMIMGMLEDKSPNIKQLQTDVSGFLDKDAAPFCLSLWKLCLSAQEDPNGVPRELLDAKTEELKQERLAEETARREALLRQDEDRERDREMDRIRERERGQRGRGGGIGYRGRDRDRDRYRDDRDRDYDRSYDRRPPVPRYSRSPPPPRRRDGPRRTDSYMPSNRGRHDDEPRRHRRSPSYGRSLARSRSPPRRLQRRNTSSDLSRSSPPRRNRVGSDDIDRPSRQDDRQTLRSQSPRMYRQRSPDYNNARRRSPPRSRSPARRDRRGSTRTRSPPHEGRRASVSHDLIYRTDRTSNSHRLQAPSQDSSPYGDSRHASDAKSTDGGAAVNEKFIKERNKGVPVALARFREGLAATRMERAVQERQDAERMERARRVQLDRQRRNMYEQR